MSSLFLAVVGFCILLETSTWPVDFGGDFLHFAEIVYSSLFAHFSLACWSRKLEVPAKLSFTTWQESGNHLSQGSTAIHTINNSSKILH